MRILSVHNFYQHAGGEDRVFADEASLLESAGHTVIRLTETNDRISHISKARLMAATLWSRESYQRVYSTAVRERVEIVHFHNTFPLISPSAYYAAQRAGAAVVQSLHNYRLICPAANLLRDGVPCELCVPKAVAWPAIRYSCYRQDRLASAGVVAMLAWHRATGTFQKKVNAYIALTPFSRSRYAEGGLPAERIYIKPNFTQGHPVGKGGDHFLFVGRLSEEKGVKVLVDAWRSNPDMPPLRIVGDGPMAPWLSSEVAGLRNVEWVGSKPHEQVLDEMRIARFLVLPSICYEGLPVSLPEAFAAGLPVIASDAGALPDLVKDGRTGVIFRSGDPLDLARKVLMTSAAGPFSEYRAACRAEFEGNYQPEQNLRLLLDIYQHALENRVVMSAE